MDWVTAVWAMLIGGCVAMAAPHLVVALWQRPGRAAHLSFVVTAAAVIAIAVCEMLMMRASTPGAFAREQQWTHVPIFVLTVGLVAFVRLYFRTGRLWLGVTVCTIRFTSLIINFAFPPSLNFRQITNLRHLPFLGQTVSIPVGVISPWTRLGELSSLLLLVFVVDASVSLWRQGNTDDRRRAVVVGGSIACFILVAAGMTALTHRHIFELPYIVSFPFTAILVAIAFELGSDLLRTGQLAQKLETSEASLQESEARFQTIANAAPVAMWMSGPDKLCTFFNAAWLEFTGRAMEQERGNGWSDGVHPDDADKCLQTYVGAFDSHEPFTMQYRLRNHKGEYRWISDHGVPRYDARGRFLGYIGSVVDITDVITKEAALRESEERMRLAADAVDLGIWEWDLSKDEIWATNARRALLGGPTSGKVGFEDFISRVHPEDRNRLRQIIEHAINEGKDYESEYRLVLPDGIVRWMATRGSVQFDENGNPARVRGISADITARKQAEEEAQRSRDQISRLSRASLLGEMTASLAHELGQPLSAIIGNANAGVRFIDKGKIDSSALREILADVAADGARAHDIIQNVRSTINKGRGNRLPLNLNDVVMKVKHIVEADAAVRSCEVHTSLAKDLPSIEGDIVQIQQVLINLIGNALDAMRSTPPDKRKLELITERNGNGSMRVAVRDYGCGIPHEARKRLFDQFFTTKEEGLGMGLAIARSIVHAHGGEIEAENVDGGGARFYFTLPASTEFPT
jgi:PAS domain S-box-containing protein